MSLTSFRPRRPLGVRQQIADHLRELIRSGELAPGTKLPATAALAVQWGTHAATVHASLATLVKEGLLSRQPGVGTIVQGPATALTSAAIYASQEMLAHPAYHFQRLIHAELGRQLAAAGGALVTVYDRRPMQACTTPPEELASLVRRRQVQGILLPCGNASILGWLQQLAVPFATISSANWLRQRVRFDMCQFIALAIAELAARGCRSAGMISAVPLHDVNPDGSEHELLAFWRTFARLMRSHGLAWREEWVIAADGPLARPAEDQARFGYRAMRHLWRQPARPEGLIVYTDALTPGVVAALLQDSVPVPRDLQLALHHCPETPLLCPLPAAYLEADLAAVATGLLDLLQRQLAGQPVEPVTIPFVLRHHTPEE